MPPPIYIQPNANTLNQVNKKIDTTGMPALYYPNQPNIDPNMPPLVTAQQSRLIQHNKQNPNQTYAIPSNLAPALVNRANKPIGGGKRRPTKKKRRAKKSMKQRRIKGRQTYRKRR